MVCRLLDGEENSEEREDNELQEMKDIDGLET